MKISEQWLREWVNPKVDINQLAEQLTMAGLEVEGVEDTTIAFSGVIAARVESLTPHPDADALALCQVDTGKGEIIDVVCGAPNVHVGMLVALAPAGATLSGGKSIKAGKIRGVKSEGMLCSAAELGLGDDAGGLIELPDNINPGQLLSELLTSNDNVIDVSLTPNRGDCLSILGIAREIAVINGIELSIPEYESVTISHKDQRQVRLEAADACPHYAGRVIKGLDVGKPSPLWLKERLARSGIRSINVVVDITNYVMLELGQPMHAFDNDLLQGDIHIRYAKEGETLTLLDTLQCKLAKDALVIADDKTPQAMAGIMGGLDSAVTANSRDVFLESAWFAPISIIGEARRYGLHTDSSHRFERGVDPTLQVRAIERASSLILSICGGAAGPITEASARKHLPKKVKVKLQGKQIPRLLGIDIKSNQVSRILSALGMQVTKNKSGWEVIPPPWRFDIGIEADLIEELARINGYDAIPGAAPLIPLHVHGQQHDYQLLQRIRELLVNRGYQEAITYSFVDKSIQAQIAPDEEALALVNPIASDLSVMRTSLLPGLIQALQFNIKRQQGRVRLFELGLVYHQRNKAVQQFPVIGGVVYGNILDKQWHTEDMPCDYFDIKGDVEALLALCGHDPATQSFTPLEHPALHPGQSAAIYIDGEIAGFVGCLHPALQVAWDLPRPAYFFELEIRRILLQIHRRYRKISKFPVVRRDLAIVIDEAVPACRVLECIRKQASDHLINLQLFDVYQGEGIDLGKKSLALGLTFQGSSSTLTEAEVEAEKGNILARLGQELGATLRD